MKRQQLVEPDVPDAVPVGQHERAVADHTLQLPEPAARQGRLAGVDQVDLPRLHAVAQRDDLAVLQ